MADEQNPETLSAPLFADLVKRQEQRIHDETGTPPPPPMPPARPTPPPTLDPSNVVFGDPGVAPVDGVGFSPFIKDSVFDPSRLVPQGRLLPSSDPNAAELNMEDDTLPEPTDDRFVILKQDVWEEVYTPDSDRPTHILRFTKGQRVPKEAIAHMKVRAVEQSQPMNIETKGVN